MSDPVPEQSARVEPATPGRDDAVSDLASRLPALDVLRGIAICWVIAFHLTVNVAGFNPPIDTYRELRDAARAGHVASTTESLWHLVRILGYEGVPLFMMLSGFTLSYGVLRSGRKDSLLSSYRRRFTTLLPPYWLAFVLTMATIVALAWARSLLRDPGFTTQLTDFTASGHTTYPVDWTIILAGAALLPRGLRDAGINAPSPSLWFVFLIAQFYLLFPVLFGVLRRTGPWVFVALALTITIAAKVPFAMSHGGHGLLLNWWVDTEYLPFNLFTFALGMSIAWLFVHDRESIRRYTSGRLDSLLLIYAGIALQTAGTLAQSRSGLTPIFAGPMIVLGLTMIVLPWIANATAARPQARWLAALASAGAISYSMLIASDPLQFAVGTLYTLDSPILVWSIFWILYLPLLFALTWCVEQASRAITGALRPTPRHADAAKGGIPRPS